MEDREILEKFCKNPIGINYSETKQAISNLLKENENLKQASIINDSLYKEVCNKNKELEEEKEKLKKVKSDEFIVNNPWLFKYLSEVYIPKSLIKEKIEELENKIKLNKKELDKNPDPMNSKFYSFDDYFKWKNKILKENEILKHTLKFLEKLLKEE